MTIFIERKRGINGGTIESETCEGSEGVAFLSLPLGEGMFLPRSHCVLSKFLFWDDSETRTTANILQVNT